MSKDSPTPSASPSDSSSAHSSSGVSHEDKDTGDSDIHSGCGAAHHHGCASGGIYYPTAMTNLLHAINRAQLAGFHHLAKALMELYRRQQGQK